VDAGPVVAIAVFTLLVAAGQYLFPDRAKRIERALAAERRALVAEAEGTVRLTGRVRRIGDLLQSPLSGRPCVAFEMVVSAKTTITSPGAPDWLNLVDIQEACPFLVADESGEARIDTSGPFRLAVVHDRRGTTSWLDEYPGKHGELALYLEAAGVVTTGWHGRWKAFHYREGVIAEEQIVTVGASSVHEPDPTVRSDPRSVPERLVLRGREDSPLLISGTRVEG
jgi:hypothetical protein